jgi:hypothetical protein
MTDPNSEGDNGRHRSRHDDVSETKEEVDHSTGRTLRREEGHDAVGLRERLKHFTWAWFTCTMSGGGLGIALAEEPYKFRGELQFPLTL